MRRRGKRDERILRKNRLLLRSWINRRGDEKKEETMRCTVKRAVGLDIGVERVVYYVIL